MGQNHLQYKHMEPQAQTSTKSVETTILSITAQIYTQNIEHQYS